MKLRACSSNEAKPRAEFIMEGLGDARKVGRAALWEHSGVLGRSCRGAMLIFLSLVSALGFLLLKEDNSGRKW